MYADDITISYSSNNIDDLNDNINRDLNCLKPDSAETVSGRVRGEWPSGLYSLRQVTEVKLGRVRSDFGWVTSED